MDLQTVEKVAFLARLKLSPEEQEKMKDKFEQVLKHFELLSQVDTSNIEPLVTPTDIEYVFRDDIPETDLTTEGALANAPLRQGNLFKVPPVL